MKKRNFKEYFNKRILFFVSLVFIYVVPVAYLAYKTFQIEKVDKNFTINFIGIVCGIIYMAFLKKRIMKKVDKMPPSAITKLILGFNSCVPFAIIALIAYLCEYSFANMYISMWVCFGCIVIGTILQAIEWTYNKDYLLELELEKEARKEIMLEKKKEMIRKELEEMGENETNGETKDQ